MPSLTQKEELTKIRQLSNVFSFVYLRDYQERNHQFWRGIIIYSWYFIQMTGLYVLCSNHISSDNDTKEIQGGGSSSTTIFHLWMKVTIYSRFNPILQTFSNEFSIPAIYLTILLLFDLIFIYFFVFLSKKSTKIHENNFKLNYNKILYVTRFLCTYPTSLEKGQMNFELSSSQNLCSYLPSFENLSGQQGAALTILCLLNALTLVISLSLVFIMNHSAEFTPSSPFKSRYSEVKIFEYLLIIISQYLAFVPTNTYVYLGINIKIVYYLFEYFTNYPLYRTDISAYYLKILSVFIYCSLLMNMREFTHLIDESYHLECLFIGSSFVYGFITVFHQQIRIHILTLKLSEEPVSYPNFICQHFYEILQLYSEMKQSVSSAKLVLHGMLTSHQSGCNDIYCPCQLSQDQLNRDMVDKHAVENVIVKQRKTRVKSDCNQEIAIKLVDKQQEGTCKGVYFTDLMNREEQFQKWIYEFVNYHFRYLIFKSKKERNYNVENISMKFWFFLINDRHNMINGLYVIKSQLENIQSKSFFLQIIDLSVTRLIENTIKQKDRKKDMEEAIQFEIFEQFVLSEVIKDRFKKDLIGLLDEKVNLMQFMIEGYEELDTMQNQMLKLINSSIQLENIIKNELRYSSSNLHYLKMLSILRIKIQNDPIFATKIEKKIEEVHSKSLAQDANLIHSLTVLNGNVISIIASFQKEKGKILRYSERTPSFFGYKKTAFDSSVKSVLQLMPSIISINHDQIIERLIVEGEPKIMRTYRVAIAKDKDGYLFPIKIYINYYFQINDDFIFSALILKLTSQSSYVLLNSHFEVEGITKTFLDFLLQIDEDVSRDQLEKIPLQLFVPDLKEIIEKSHEIKIEGVKIPMIVPEKMSKYFMGYKSYVKKMQGRNHGQNKFVEQFLNQSKKYFREDVFIFEWSINIVKDNFKLLKGQEFTVYLIEIQSITPIQIIQNGLKTTQKASNDGDSFAPQPKQHNHQQTKHNKHGFEFDSTMFTHQYSQDQIKKKFHFKQGYSQVNDSQNEFSDQKTMNLSSRYNNQSPILDENKKIFTLKEKELSSHQVIQSAYEIQEEQDHNNMKQIMQQQLIKNKDHEMICQKSLNINQTDQSSFNFTGNITKNQNSPLLLPTQKNDLLMEMTEEEINNLRRTYDNLDDDAAQGADKNLPNGEFPARMELESNQQFCNDSLTIQEQQKQSKQSNSKSNHFMKQLSTQKSSDQFHINGLSAKQETLEEEKNSPSSNLTQKQQPQQQNQNQQQLNRLQSKIDKKTEDEEAKKQRLKQRMSVIQEHLNDSDIDINMTQNELGDTKLNETNQNLITQQFATENFKTEVNQSGQKNNLTSAILVSGNQFKYDMNSTINMTIQHHQYDENKLIENEEGDQQQNSQNNTDQKINNQQDDGKVYNKNKSVASNFFNSQQYLTRNSSYEKDSNPILANLQALKESTRYSKYKDDQQELSDNPTVDINKINENSFNNQSSFKQDIRLKPMDNDQRACSVASSQNSQVSTTIQRIYYSASSKNMPFFMNLFFQVIGFQLLFFGSICTIVSLLFNSNYQGLKSLTQDLNFSSKILIPYSQNTIILNGYSTENTKMINFSEPYQTLSKDIQNSTLTVMETDIFGIINQHVQYGFQEDYLSSMIRYNLQSDGTQLQSNIFFFESVKSIYENLFYLFQNQPTSVKLGMDQQYIINMNYYPIEDMIELKVTQGMSSQINVIHSRIEDLNKSIIIVSCSLLFLCFILLFYPFYRYSQYVKGVLLSVSRMTEKEAEQEIITCKFLSSLLKSSEEKYLSIKYTSFDLTQLQSDEFGFSSHFNPQIRNRSNKTHLKKNYMLSQRINKPRIRLYHFATYFAALFVFSVAIFATAYSIISQFNNSLIPGLNTYEDYLHAFQKYGSFVYSTDQIFTQRVLKINKSIDGILGSDQMTLLNQRRELNLKQFTSFFESDFLFLTEKNIFTDSLNNYINQVQKSDLCLLTNLFNPSQIQICKSAMSSIMQQGLKAVITKISDDVGMKQIDSWSDELVLEHIKLNEYENQLQVIQLTFLVLQQIEKQILDDILQLIDKYINQIVLIYSIGGVLYGFAFVIVCYSVYQNIYRRFFLIKKTVHLMPYKRLQDDQTTMNLIKNALEG